MDAVWAFLGDETNRAILGWLGGGLVVIAGGVWTTFKFVLDKNDKGPATAKTGTVQASGGGIASGGDIRIDARRGVSGREAILLVLGVVGAMLLAAGLSGDWITANNSVAIGGDVTNSTINVNSPAAGGAEP